MCAFDSRGFVVFWWVVADRQALQIDCHVLSEFLCDSRMLRSITDGGKTYMLHVFFNIEAISMTEHTGTGTAALLTYNLLI